jgi:hypothetical protein
MREMRRRGIRRENFKDEFSKKIVKLLYILGDSISFPNTRSGKSFFF